jgi:thioredoxin 1
MAGPYTNVTDGTFKEVVLESSLPAIVDFWATWCTPCLRMAPNFEALAVEYQGKVLFVKMDTDENPDVPSHYNIQGIPTLIVFNGGKEIGRIIGFQSKDAVKRQLDAALGALA